MYRVRYARPATSLSGTFFQAKKNPELRMGREKFGVQGLNR